MQRNYILITLFTMFAGFLIAQKATLTGKITDLETGEPLIGATVQTGSKGTVADEDGNYSLILDAGSYTLEISFIGYKIFRQQIELRANETTTLNATLSTETNLLNTTTVTSGKYEKPLSEVTVSLDVLQPRLIENTAKVTIDEALDKIPGVNVIDGQANIRGGSGYSYGAGSRVLLLVDDVPILQADAGFPNWDDVPIENIEQLEVVKGAASALYGSSALNGIINVRTAVPKAEPETRVSTFYNAYFSPKDERLKWWDSAPYTAGASLSHRRKFKKLDLVLGGYYLNEESYNKNTFKKFGRFNFTTNYRISDRFTIGINANFNKGESGSFFYWISDTMAYIGTPSSITSRERFRYNIDPHITYFDKAGNRHKFLGRYYYVDNNNSSNQSNQSDILYGEYQFQRRFVNADFVVTAGVVGMRTNVSAELYGDTTFISKNLATYVQLEKRFWKRWNVSAGFRYENNVLENPGFDYQLGNETKAVAASEDKESKPVIRFGVNYQAADFTFLRASWGQGYRYPTIAESYIFTDAGGFFVAPSPGLGSETGWTTEFGVKQGFKISSFEGFFDATLFWSRYQDMIEFNLIQFPYFSAVNIGDTDIKGFEVSLMGRGKIGTIPLSILTGYTSIDPKYVEFDTTPRDPNKPITQGQINAGSSSSTENVLKYRPRHSFKLDLEVEFGGLSLGVETFYNSNVEAVDRLFEAFLIKGLKTFRQQHNKGYVLNNFRAAYNFTNSLKLTAVLGNAFNEVYSQRPGLLEAPRNLTVRVDYKF